MSAPEAFQIWRNAAFDDHSDSQHSSAIGASLSNLPPDFSDCSFDSHGSKENHIPSPSTASINKPLKSSFPALSAKAKRDRNIDAEIQEVEAEIRRLSARLESLRLQKAEHIARSVPLRGRIVPAKFMEHKQTTKNQDAVATVEHLPFSGAKSRINRRGVSLGPAEIKLKQPGKPNMITPLQATQNRRISCFWKLPDIDEDIMARARGRMRLSLSPKSRRAAEAQKKAATTVGSKTAVKKDEELLSTIRPKRLFKDSEKSAPAKKPLKSGRIVASRYNREKDARKRSLPDNDKQENNRCEKRQSSDENDNHTARNREKKRWEIPDEAVVYRSDAYDETPISVSKIGEELPKIRTLWRVGESPRDSGAAKRVAELVGRKCYFTSEDLEV